MNCHYLERFFSDFIDGELEQKLRDALRFHLHGCSRCRAKVADMEQTVRAVKAMVNVKPRPQFDQMLRNRLQEECTRELYGQPVWFRMKSTGAGFMMLFRRRSVQYVAAASLMLALGLAGALSWNRTTPSAGEAIAGLMVPTPIEPEPASWAIITPVPVDLRPAPMMTISFSASYVQPSDISPTPGVVWTNRSEDTVRPISRPRGIMTIQTLEPQILNFAKETAAGTTTELSTRPEDADIPVVNAFNASAVGRNALSASPKKRITRISF